MANRIISPLSQKPIIIFLILTIIIFIDISLTKIINQINLLEKSAISIFILITISSIIVTAILLFINRNLIKNSKFFRDEITNSSKIMTISQLSIIFLIALVLIQIIYQNSSYYFMCIGIVIISYIIALLFSLLLTIKSLKWYLHERGIIVLGHSIALAIISVFILSSFLYFLYGNIDDINLILKPINIKESISQKAMVLNLFETSYNISYIASFISIWSLTFVLLYNYLESNYKKIFLPVFCVPLLYFLLKFTPFGLSFLTSIIMLDPYFYGTIYTILFSGTGPLMGILFFIPLRIFASKIKNDEVKRFSIIMSFGILIFFTSNQEPPLQEKMFPPFGIIAAGFTGFAMYLFYFGMYSNVIFLAKFGLFKNYVLTKLQNDKFFRSMARSQLEQELKPTIHKFVTNFKIEESIELDKNEVEELVEVIKKEMKRSKKDK